MYDQIRQETLFAMLYAVVTAMAMLASCYLLFRQGNAFAKDVTPPRRLRRWAATFLAVIAFIHVWYMPIFFLSSSQDIRLCDLLGGLIDSMTFFPLAIVVLLTMLQDRRRPLWPVAVMFAPLAIGNALCVATLSYDFLPLYVYFLLVCLGFIIYMVRALRQYGRWLRDSFADLEHKEVWQSFAMLAIVMLVFVAYTFIYEGPAYLYATQLACAVLICYLPWRVETLSDLSIPVNDSKEETVTTDHAEDNDNPLSIRNNIESLLQQHCIDKQLYLQHDLTLLQLAKTVGTNRSYLSQYFSNQGTTYNAYINDLRIQHFISLYRMAVDSQRSFTAQQLAQESGFYTYRTFSEAFKRKTGQSVSAWMKIR